MTARKLILPFVAASLLLPACNPVDNPDDPNGSGGGNPVVFTVGSRGSTTTKTSYSGTGTTSQGKLRERIDWEEDDSLTVSCLKTTPTSATYVIKGDIETPSGDPSRSQAKKIEPVETGTFPNGKPKTSGLQWGEGTHRFYAVYPEVKSSSPKDIMSLTITKVDNTDKGEISAKIPATQTYYRDSIITGTSIRHLVPSHRFPYMWAATQADEKANFSLSFSPMVTAFQFTVGGDGTVTDEITITGFELESSTCALAGADAYVTLVTDASTAGTFTASYSTYVDLVTEGTNKNNSVTFTMPSGTNAPKISSTKQLRFMVFVYPFGKSTTRNVLDGLKVKFSTSVGGRALELKYSDTATPANAGKWVEFPAGCKINISNLQLPQQLAPWTYTVTVGNWDEELPEVVVSPVKVTEFEIDDITMQDDVQHVFGLYDEGGNRLDYLSLSADESVADVLKSLTVKSYKESEHYGTQTPVAWTVSYLDEEGNEISGGPDWLGLKTGDGTAASAGGDGSVAGEARSLALGANSNDNDNPSVSVAMGENLIKTLRDAEDVGMQSDPHDLSKYNIYGEAYGSQTRVSSITGSGHYTANCYVVSAPGYYCFPLVYGNAIKDSQPNSAAYGATLTDGKGWFRDANGSKITSPYVLSSGANLSDYDAVAVWQDVLESCPVVRDADIELVSAASVGSSLSCPYIRFRIKRGSATEEPLTAKPGYPVGDGILPCNIMIAVRDKNQQDPADASKPLILWSWHIWVTPTPHEYAPGGTPTGGDDFAIREIKYRRMSDYNAASADLPSVKFLNCNLGWTPPLFFHRGGTFPRRGVVLRFTQADGKTVDFPVEQRAGTPNPDDGGQVYSAAFYQYGRKDPFLPGKALTPDAANRPYYSDSGYSLNYKDSKTCIKSINVSSFNGNPDVNINTLYTRMTAIPYIFHGTYSEKYLGIDLYTKHYSTADTDPDSFHWNIQGSGHDLESVTKTIYDPSPAGFCVPFYQAYSGLFKGALRNQNGTDYSRQYIVPSTEIGDFYGEVIANKGVMFPNDGTAEGTKDFFIPYCGWRSNNNYGDLSFNLIKYNGEGPWTSGFKKTDTDSYGTVDADGYNNGSYFVLYSNSAYLRFSKHSRGNPVRPILEQ